MAEHLNRLTNEDALKWNKAFKQFCKTGVWEIENKDKTMVEQLGKAMNKSEFPASRDWDLEAKIPCANKKCACHSQSFGKGVCGVPSMMAIDSHGKCTGYKPKKKSKKGRNNG